MPSGRTTRTRSRRAAPCGRPVVARAGPDTAPCLASPCVAGPSAGGLCLSRPRRGVVCIVAMLFLVLFAVLALGFYAATAMSMQLSANERSAHSSQIAAESGMQFIRYQLDALDIPADRPPAQVFEEV